METVKISLNGNAKVAFARINREYRANTTLKDSIKSLGVLTKLTLINTKLMLENGFEVYDPITNDVVNEGNCSFYPYTVIDGQHRYMCAYEIYSEAYNEHIKAHKTNDYVSPIKTNLTGDCYMTIDELPNSSINTLIIALNNNSRSWNSSDFIKNKVQLEPNSPLIKLINLLNGCKFPITTISLCLTGKKRIINNKSISNYKCGHDEELDKIDYKKPIAVLYWLLTAGFDLKYLRSRYIWEFLWTSKQVLKLCSIFLSFKEREDSDFYIETIEKFKDDVNGLKKFIEKYQKKFHIKKKMIYDDSDANYNEICAALELIKVEIEGRKQNPKAPKGDIWIGDNQETFVKFDMDSSPIISVNRNKSQNSGFTENVRLDSENKPPIAS